MSRNIVRIARETMRGRQVDLAPDISHVLGPELAFVDCEVVIRKRSANALRFDRARFERCAMKAKRPLYQCTWNSVVLTDCVFTGSFVGNQFGQMDAWAGVGRIESCDFRGADVHNVRIFRSPVDTLRFPSWPFFVVRTPTLFRERLQEVGWPPDLDLWGQSLGNQPVETSALVYDAARVASFFGASIDDLRRALLSIGDDVVRVS